MLFFLCTYVTQIKEGSTQEATKPIDLEETPLSCACANGYYVIMKLLLLNGANINYICSVSCFMWVCFCEC